MLSELFSKLARRDLPKSTQAGRLTRPETGTQQVPVAPDERPQTRKFRITFDVDAVAPAEKPIWTEALEDSLARRFQRKVLILPEPDQRVINALVALLTKEQRKNFELHHSSTRC